MAHSYEHSMKSDRRSDELGLEQRKLESGLTYLNIIIYVSRSNRQKQAENDENKTELQKDNFSDLGWNVRREERLVNSLQHLRLTSSKEF